MSDWKPYVETMHLSDGGRQMEAMLNKLDEKERAKRFAARIGRVAERLTASQRKLLIMVVLERMPAAEIRRRLGIAPRTFRQRIDMLVKKILKIFPKTTPRAPAFGVIGGGTRQTTDRQSARRGSWSGATGEIRADRRTDKRPPSGSTMRTHV